MISVLRLFFYMISIFTFKTNLKSALTSILSLNFI